MSTLAFSLSANFPGFNPANQWDLSWTPAATRYRWNSTATGDETATAPAVMLSGSSTETDSFFAVDFGGTHLSSVTPLVTAASYLQGGVRHQDVTLNAVWNTIKDIQVGSLDTQALKVNGFVDTWINDGTDSADRAVEIDGVKRGQVLLGNGNDSLTINYISNETSWSNIFSITMGDGNDTISIHPESFAAIAATPTPDGWVFNRTPQATSAFITVGNGNDTVDLEASGFVAVGSGTDVIKLTGGVHVVHLGGGSDTVQIAGHTLAQPATAAFSTQRDVNTIYASTGQAKIFIDDSAGAMTPLTNLHMSRGHTGGGTETTADVIRYGHTDPTTGAFTGGDWSALRLDLTGYSAGSTASLIASASGDHALLEIRDAATGSTDFLALYGAKPPALSSLHLNLQTGP